MNFSRPMNLSRQVLLALCIGLCAAGVASAQDDKFDKPMDFKPLVPPVVPLPPNARINPGTVGNSPTPYTTAPLQNPNLAPTQSTPGLKLTLPAR